tara:strand:- start:248 stop:460 length:213 start_codon:yes stop_codon:yes gene_type:complete
MNYSQKVLFDDWIKRCPIDGVFVDEPVSQVQMDDGRVGYLLKSFLLLIRKIGNKTSLLLEFRKICPLRIA